MPRKGLRLVAPTAAALLGRHWREQPRAAALRGSPWPGPPVPVALRGSPWHRELEAVALLGSTRYAVTRAPEHFSGPGCAGARLRRAAAWRRAAGSGANRNRATGSAGPRSPSQRLQPSGQCVADARQRGFFGAGGPPAYLRRTRK